MISGQLMSKEKNNTFAELRLQVKSARLGMGNNGTEMVKALTWYGQMDGYRLEINAFDKDELAEEKFVALAPELMSSDYNGVYVEGEAQYQITIHPDVDVRTITFADKISKITNASYVFVALGNDDMNINTAVNLRMYFERIKIHPVIQAVVYNSQQRKALEGIANYRGQAYDIEFVGDIESSYTEDVIIDSELEYDALKRHLKWGKEEEFWTYEYNYRSSMASAIHMKARVKCGIPGADKKEEELSDEERNVIEVLEHRMLSMLDKSRKRPRATFLFAGPPGVGKTFLAEKAAEALKLPFMRFDMSEYSDKEANIEFCGSDKVYKNGKAGTMHPINNLLTSMDID